VKPLLQVTAISAAWVTCLSRIVDYYHRGTDVLGGAILGAIIAFVFTCYFGRVIWEFDKKQKKSDFDLLKDENELNMN
jgi:membrane-associated phospholipid phosphatase